MIEKWLRDRFIDVVLTSDREDVRINCPFCQFRFGKADTKYHLYVSLTKPVSHCFRCGWTGHYLALVMSVEGCTYTDALQYVYGLKKSVNISEFDRIFSPSGLFNVEPLIRYPDGFMPLSERGRGDIEQRAVYNYAKSRIGRIKNWTMYLDYFGWVPGTGRLWIIVDDGYWQGRAIDNSMPKYLNPPWPIGDGMWNSKILDADCSSITICEGVFSAIHAGADAIALAGKTGTDAQLRRIVKAGKARITIMLDADARLDAINMAGRLIDLGFPGDMRIYQLVSGDPADSLDGKLARYDWSSRVEYAL